VSSLRAILVPVRRGGGAAWQPGMTARVLYRARSMFLITSAPVALTTQIYEGDLLQWQDEVDFTRSMMKGKGGRPRAMAVATAVANNAPVKRSTTRPRKLVAAGSLPPPPRGSLRRRSPRGWIKVRTERRSNC
jgi:hypothetical protein